MSLLTMLTGSLSAVGFDVFIEHVDRVPVSSGV